MYEKDTQISEKTINQVVEWYDRKVEMLREFQLGIHPFHRKLTFLKSIDDDRTPEKFIIITKKANDVKSDCTLRKIEQLKKNNFLEIPVSIIFSIQDGERFIFPYYNYDAMIKEALDREIPLIREHSFTFISPGNVRTVLSDYNMYVENEIVFGIVDAQIHCALHNGISVVFEDDEIDENRISHYMNISREYNVLDIEEN